MPQKSCQLSANANTGNYVQIDANVSELALLNATNASGVSVNVVFGVDSAAAAAAAQTANQHYILTAGTTPTSMLNNVRCNPTRTWVRSTDATARVVNINFAW